MSESTCYGASAGRIKGGGGRVLGELRSRDKVPGGLTRRKRRSWTSGTLQYQCSRDRKYRNGNHARAASRRKTRTRPVRQTRQRGPLVN
eukprot:1185469-Prorocentrum_minimum.AAC.2